MKCSTPFGIRDGCSRVSDSSKLEMMVLNAFRHQRWVQPGSFFFLFFTPMCSTPFGIRDGCSSCRSCFGVNLLMCSTPFGIRDGCSCYVIVMRQIFSCSTPFGIRDGCSFSSTTYFRYPSKCSTPFGIRDGCRLRTR